MNHGGSDRITSGLLAVGFGYSYHILTLVIRETL